MNLHARKSWLWVVMLAVLAGQEAPPPPPDSDATADPVSSVPVPVGSPLIAGGGKVAIIRIEGEIGPFTVVSLRRRVDRALVTGATVIVFELDTPGGRVSSALDIAKFIKADIPVPTIAWVNRKAYSAGILIASACDQIVMAPASTTGDCAPIAPGTELAPTERAKILSPILEEFRDNARNNGYDYAMFQAMCVLGIEVYRIEHQDSGEQRLVNQADYRIMVDGEPFPKPAANPSAAQFDLFGASPEIATQADRGHWTLVKQFHDGKTLLTVNQDRAYELGLAQVKDMRSDSQITIYTNASTIVRIPETWSDDMVRLITSPIVRGVLVLALVIGAYMEFQSPGLGAPGAVAVIALVALLGAPFLAGLDEVWPLLLFFLGFILLMVELLIIPGFGAFGITGLLCMFVGLVMQIVPTPGRNLFNLPSREAADQLEASLLWMTIAAAGSLVGLIYLFKSFESIPLLNRLILRDGGPAPAWAGIAAMPVSGAEVIGGGLINVGAVGRVVAELRPTGRAEIDGQIIDVITPGNLIALGQSIHVIEVHGNRIVVDAVEAGG